MNLNKSKSDLINNETLQLEKLKNNRSHIPDIEYKKRVKQIKQRTQNKIKLLEKESADQTEVKENQL